MKSSVVESSQLFKLFLALGAALNLTQSTALEGNVVIWPILTLFQTVNN